MGSPNFAIPSLNLLADQFQVVGVVTQPDRQSGRGQSRSSPPVKKIADELLIPIIQPGRLRDPEAFQQLLHWKPDLIVVAAFGQILRTEVLNLPKLGCINVHASLLPRWRGAAPIQAAIFNGDEKTGVTIMKMDPGIDTGPILTQLTIPISNQDTAETLSDKLSIFGAELLIKTLPGYINGTLFPSPQPEINVTYAPMLKKEDGLLDLNKKASQLVNQIRAYNPWPGAYIIWKEQMLKIFRAHALDKFSDYPPGAQLVFQHSPGLNTGEGILILDEVQLPGRKIMPGKVFLSGAHTWGNLL